MTFDINLFSAKTYKHEVSKESLENHDKDFFRKCREILNKIIKLIGINNPINVFEADVYADGFITADVYENTSFVVEGGYGYRYNNVVIVLHSVINNYLKESLVQHRY